MIGWIVLGIIITICIFIFVPGLFAMLVSIAQWVAHSLSGILHSNITPTNMTG